MNGFRIQHHGQDFQSISIANKYILTQTMDSLVLLGQLHRRGEGDGGNVKTNVRCFFIHECLHDISCAYEIKWEGTYFGRVGSIDKTTIKGHGSFGSLHDHLRDGWLVTTTQPAL